MAQTDDTLFFRYYHNDGDKTQIFEYQEDPTQFANLMDGDLSEIPDKLTEMGFDAILILDHVSKRWYLSSSTNLGIVGERTSRRQADSIARSGIKLPDGYWVKANYPMEELSDPNLGDLWKSVQNKYLTSDLSGLEIDPETGLPKQLKERAERLSEIGEEVDYSQELKEAENRKKAIKRSGHSIEDLNKASKSKTTSKIGKIKDVSTTKGKKTSKKTTKKTAKTSKKEKVEEEKVETKPVASKKVENTVVSTNVMTNTRPALGKISKPGYFEIGAMVEYVDNGNTVLVVKGKLTEGKKKPKSMTLTLDPYYISKKDFQEVVLWLGEGDVVEVTHSKVDNVNYVASIKT